MTSTQSEVWLDGQGWPPEPPVSERWVLWGIPVTTFLPIVAELLAGTAPRWFGWVLIGVFLLGLLRYAASRLRHAAAVIDAMPVAGARAYAEPTVGPEWPEGCAPRR